MADSQSGSNVFSLRIVSIDYYMASPIPGYNICYSSFQGSEVNEVPVIRIYGSTPAGQKTCLHIHRVRVLILLSCFKKKKFVCLLLRLETLFLL
jgi:DNA polymerase zeta